ncbi:hypothetical protein [Anatilimnocola floriformis]|uniref:hypothetical protein n=1 Tax=Anatilimnocola floriformis TaxID=2948575 RepID=UPI0020C51E27|nr:hypothetical protein [Anatilimnocola floriformis]
MFGDPNWFRPKTVGWGLKPITWQGWGYAATWIGVITVPFLLMLSWHMPTQSLVWLAVMSGGLFYDVRDIRKQIQRAQFQAAAPPPVAADKDVLYIGDSDSGTRPLATRNYSLKLK